MTSFRLALLLALTGFLTLLATSIWAHLNVALLLLAVAALGAMACAAASREESRERVPVRRRRDGHRR